MHTRHVTERDQPPGGLAEASVAGMRALVDAVTAITRVQDDPEQMLEQIVEAARTVSGAEYAALGIVGPEHAASAAARAARCLAAAPLQFRFGGKK